MNPDFTQNGELVVEGVIRPFPLGRSSGLDGFDSGITPVDLDDVVEPSARLRVLVIRLIDGVSPSRRRVKPIDVLRPNGNQCSRLERFLDGLT